MASAGAAVPAAGWDAVSASEADDAVFGESAAGWPQAASNRAETRGSRRMRMMVLSMMNGWVSGSLIIGGQEAT